MAEVNIIAIVRKRQYRYIPNQLGISVLGVYRRGGGGGHDLVSGEIGTGQSL